MSGGPELIAAEGFIEDDVRAEFPGLALRWVTVPGRPGPSPPELRRRLGVLSGRYRGESVVAMRTQPIPRAYRVFYRQIGLDPDITRVPSEQAAVSRLFHGGLQSRDAISDALLVALVETGVPLWALDSARVHAGGPGIRLSAGGDRLGAGADAPPLAAGQLVVADAGCVHAVLFAELAPGHAPGAGTSELTLFAVGVDGVPAIHMEEALWVAAETLRRA